MRYPVLVANSNDENLSQGEAETLDELVVRGADRLRLVPGDKIGAFKVIRELGQGGFGAVYLCEQSEPVRRQVAIKIIKPGMDSESIIARFEAEQQAVAMMSHSSIAKVFEAGTTEEGRPYFVMEYVKGVPINEYCDKNKLDTQARLKLFAKVCDGVHHAHQKGIIHRDLKPGNILVTIADRREPQPKIIDFGIAKATNQQLTEKEIFTQVGQMIGTPEYMSPEQADLNSEDVDTRTDVYSLGVVLYELLSGRLPFSPKELRSKGYAEIQRIIREEDPPRPSTQLTTLAGLDVDDDAGRIAHQRSTTIDSLSSTLRRELEWIPLKALRKDRSDRYASADALGEDVRRYLEGEALEAGPESTGYRLRKLVRRNKGPVIAAALITMTLIAGIIGTTIFAFSADRQRRLAEEQRDLVESQRIQTQREFDRAESVKNFVTTMLSSIDPRVSGPMDKELMTLVLSNAASNVAEEFSQQPATESELRAFIGYAFFQLGLFDEAEPHLVGSLKMCSQYLGQGHPETLRASYNLGSLYHAQARHDEAEHCFQEGFSAGRPTLGEDHPNVVALLSGLGLVQQTRGEYAKARDSFAKVVEVRRRILEPDDYLTLGAMHNLANIHWSMGEYAESLRHHEELLELRRGFLGNEHPDTLTSLYSVGSLHQIQGDLDQAKPFLVESLEGERRVLGPGHINTIRSTIGLGVFSYRQEDYEDALAYYLEALESATPALGDQHPLTALCRQNLGLLFWKQGRHEEAVGYYEQVWDDLRRIHGDDHPKLLDTAFYFMESLQAIGRLRKARDLAEFCVEGYSRVHGPGHDYTKSAIQMLVGIHEALHVREPDAGHDARARSWQSELDLREEAGPALDQ